MHNLRDFWIVLLVALFVMASIVHAEESAQTGLTEQSATSQLSSQTPSQLSGKPIIRTIPKELDILKKAFPDISFTVLYDKTLEDWQITATFTTGSKKSEVFYWCEGRLLPKEQLEKKANYLSLFEDYPIGGELQNPSTYTDEQIEEYRRAGLASTRKNEPFPATFILDFIYSSSTMKLVEQHLSKVTFLGHKVTVNDRVIKPLAVVETRIKELKKTNKTVATFLDKDLDHLEGYNWREIRDADRKSMHSMGIAIDFLPPKLNKHIYWRWTKDQKGDKWMLTSLSNRWMPPYEVINIFEEEGFVWGGKWLIWDNMHFEYRPEIIEYQRFMHEE